MAYRERLLQRLRVDTGEAAAKTQSRLLLIEEILTFPHEAERRIEENKAYALHLRRF